jgi:hypothetical protein
MRFILVVTSAHSIGSLIDTFLLLSTLLVLWTAKPCSEYYTLYKFDVFIHNNHIFAMF